MGRDRNNLFLRAHFQCLDTARIAICASFLLRKATLLYAKGVAEAHDVIVAAIVAIGQHLAAFKANAWKIAYQVFQSTGSRKASALPRSGARP